jgi:hypothetical protein
MDDGWIGIERRLALSAAKPNKHTAIGTHSWASSQGSSTQPTALTSILRRLFYCSPKANEQAEAQVLAS